MPTLEEQNDNKQENPLKVREIQVHSQDKETQIVSISYFEQEDLTMFTWQDPNLGGLNWRFVRDASDEKESIKIIAAYGNNERITSVPQKEWSNFKRIFDLGTTVDLNYAVLDLRGRASKPYLIREDTGSISLLHSIPLRLEVNNKAVELQIRYIRDSNKQHFVWEDLHLAQVMWQIDKFMSVQTFSYSITASRKGNLTNFNSGSISEEDWNELVELFDRRNSKILYKKIATLMGGIEKPLPRDNNKWFQDI